MDCFTCEFAERDKHGRFQDRCFGYGNCHYSEHKGKIKPTLEEYINALKSKYVYGFNNYPSDYITGVRDALSFIEDWNKTE